MSDKREPWEEWHKKNGVTAVIRECEKQVQGKWGQFVTYRYRVATHTGEWHLPTLEDARAVAKHVCGCAHKGVAYYDRQRMKRKLPATCGGPLKGPPEFIAHFPGHRWEDGEGGESGDYVREYSTPAEAVAAAKASYSPLCDGDGDKHAITLDVARAMSGALPDDEFYVDDVLRYLPGDCPGEILPVKLHVWPNEAGQWFCRYEKTSYRHRIELKGAECEWTGTKGEYVGRFDDGVTARVRKVRSKWWATLVEGAEQPWKEYPCRYDRRADTLRYARAAAWDLWTQYRAEKMTAELRCAEVIGECRRRDGNAISGVA